MRLLINPDYGTGWLVEGEDAVRLLSILSDGTQVKIEGYGATRTMSPAGPDALPGWEISPQGTLVENPDEAAVITKLRKDNSTNALAYLKKKKEDEARIAELTALVTKYRPDEAVKEEETA